MFQGGETPGEGPPNIVGMKKGHQRRLSDPSSAIHDFMRMGMLDQTPKAQPQPLTNKIFGGSETDLGLIDSFGDAHCEIYAGDLLDEFEDCCFKRNKQGENNYWFLFIVA